MKTLPEAANPTEPSLPEPTEAKREVETQTKPAKPPGHKTPAPQPESARPTAKASPELPNAADFDKTCQKRSDCMMVSTYAPCSQCARNGTALNRQSAKKFNAQRERYKRANPCPDRRRARCSRRHPPMTMIDCASNQCSMVTSARAGLALDVVAQAAANTPPLVAWQVTQLERRIKQNVERCYGRMLASEFREETFEAELKTKGRKVLSAKLKRKPGPFSDCVRNELSSAAFKYDGSMLIRVSARQRARKP